MIVSRLTLYFLLQAFCVTVLLICQVPWIAGRAVDAGINRFYTDHRLKYGTKDFVVVNYIAGGKDYTARFGADALDHRLKVLHIRYLTFLPSIARVDDFVGNWGLHIVVYFIWCFVTSLLFFVPNDIVPKSVLFRTGWRFPWVKKV